MSMGELLDVRKSILNFFQDLKIRVSVFMRQKLQNSDGKFVIETSGLVPPGCDIPGEICLYDETGEVRSVTKFDCGVDYCGVRQLGSFEVLGDRYTNLGCNIYATASEHCESCPVSSCHAGDVSSRSAPEKNFKVTSDIRVGQGELNLLMTQLLGNRTNFDCNLTKDLIQITLFNSETKEGEGSYQESDKKEIKIDARTHSNFADLDVISKEMAIVDTSPNSEDTGGDLLELLDSLK